MLRERLSRFLSDPASADFEALALEVFRYQVDRIPAYRRLVAGDPEAVRRWQDVPPVPTRAFQTLELHTDPAIEVFRSSGTTSGRRSVHHHPFPDLYRAAVDLSFPRWVLPGLDRPPVLALVPPRQAVPDSSLSFMVDHVVSRFGGDGSAWAFGERGVEVPAARSWLGARQRDRRPCLVMATSFALVQLLDALERRYLHFRLAPGSVVFDTGGTKGREREVPREQLLARLEEFLGVPAAQVVREYGMTELTSQAYTGNLAGERGDLFHLPHWMRVRALDPATLAELPPGEEGLLAFFDLANLGSAAHLLTEDLGAVEGEAFRLAGRAAEAEVRGCSLVVEEMASNEPRHS